MRLIGPMAHRWRAAAAIAGFAAAFSADPALAQAVKQLGVYHDWTVYSANTGNGAICFAVSKPVEVTPSPDGYTQAYLYLTHRPAEQVNNELNLVAGFNMGEDQPVVLSVAGSTYPLFAQADAAWLQDPTKNDDLAGMMRAGTTAVIDMTNDKGIKVKETFSLSGATAASKAISSGC